MVQRCGWAGDSGPMTAYHDEEWGVPVRDTDRLFEFLTLEGAQAGLSWDTILRKRRGYRKAFDNFNLAMVAAYGEDKVQSLLQDAAIVRNRLKIRSTLTNARAALDVKAGHGSFVEYVWGFVKGRTITNARVSWRDIPDTTPESDRMSKGLKGRGFKFVGPTICYAFMQATGMVNDHEVSCFRYNEV